MEIKVSEIPEEGLRVLFTEDPERLSGLGDDVKALSPATAGFSLRKVGSTVFLTGDVACILELVCSRCGKPYPFAVKAALELDINPVEALAEGEETELTAGDLDVEFYLGDVVDLSGVLREQVILQAPMKPLCGEGCRGLCQFCGQDLNEARCACETPDDHVGLAALGDLIKKKEENR